MSDLVKRLRGGEQCGDPCRVKDAGSGCICAEAADRIEALQAALREIIDERDGCVSPGFKAKASAALAPEQDQ